MDPSEDPIYGFDNAIYEICKRLQKELVVYHHTKLVQDLYH